jgi:hypothetical protein
MKEFEISTKGYAMVDRDVKTGQTTGRVFVPKNWIGHNVRVILLEPLTDSEE